MSGPEAARVRAYLETTDVGRYEVDGRSYVLGGIVPVLPDLSTVRAVRRAFAELLGRPVPG